MLGRGGHQDWAHWQASLLHSASSWVASTWGVTLSYSGLHMYIHMCTPICTSVHMCGHTYTYTTHIHTHILSHTHKHTLTHSHTCTRTHTHTTVMFSFKCNSLEQEATSFSAQCTLLPLVTWSILLGDNLETNARYHQLVYLSSSSLEWSLNVKGLVSQLDILPGVQDWVIG